MNRKLQKPIKVFATSAILTTMLFTPMMTNHLNVHIGLQFLHKL